MTSSSLRSRLGKAAKEMGLRMPQAQLLLAQERFLFRIAHVDTEKNIVWKGGSLILRRYSDLKPPRFTADIDLLVDRVDFAEGESLIHQATQIDLHDGFQFFGIKKSPMQRATPYGGDCYEISWSFEGKANSETLKLDLCAGDDVDPENVLLNEVYLLDDEASQATLAVYPPAFIFAEKLETMARFATGNTRLKDFIDLWTLSLTCDEELNLHLRAAVKRCFHRRNTIINSSEWYELLEDEDFQEIMEAARTRNFPKLEIPKVPELFNALKSYLKKLEPWT